MQKSAGSNILPAQNSTFYSHNMSRDRITAGDGTDVAQQVDSMLEKRDTSWADQNIFGNFLKNSENKIYGKSEVLNGNSPGNSFSKSKSNPNFAK